MQGKERMDRELLDAAALAGRLVPEGSMFAFLAAHRGELFPDTDFADLFTSSRGRPSIPASVMATVPTLQALCDYSDAETAEAARCDLRWKVACGFAVDHKGFDPSTLVYWRRGWPPRPGPTGSMTRSGRWPGRPGSCVAGGAARWTARFWRTRPPPRTQLLSSSRRSARPTVAGNPGRR